MTEKCAALRRAWSLLCVLLAIALSGAPGMAASQEPPKIENTPTIPSTVQPGAIEAQYDVEIPEGFGDAPAVLSPFEIEAPAEAQNIQFVLRSIVLDGPTVISPAEIAELYSEKIDTEIPLTDVFDIARRITQLYNKKGYLLSLAYVPIQEIENGSVRIRVLEGYIGEIDVVGASSKAARSRLMAYGKKLKSIRPMTKSALERYLLLANQIPGVKVTGVLARSDDQDGGVKLTLKAKEKKFAIAAGTNNRASAAVGREQFYGRLLVNGILTGADRFAFSAVQSYELDELTYFSGSYDTDLNSEGLTLGVKATRSEAAPGIPFLRDLGFATEGWTAGMALTYPVLVRRGETMTIASEAKWKEFRSAFDVAPNTLDRLWTTAFGVAYHDETRFDGKTSVGVTLTRGWNILGATQLGDPLASRSGASGEFIALAADASRNQTIVDGLNVIVAIKAQAANKPLLSSEQCGFGGAGIGRGYDPFEISGDQCIVGLVELQAKPDFLQWGKVGARPYVSFDAGAVRQNGQLAAGEDRAASLYSFALGARFDLTKHVSAGVEGALPLKSMPENSDRTMNFFFSLEARY